MEYIRNKRMNRNWDSTWVCVRTNTNNCWHYSICSAVSKYTTLFQPKKARSPLNYSLYSHQQTHAHTKSAGMFALRHTQQLSSLTQCVTHTRISILLSFSVWHTVKPNHDIIVCLCVFECVCAPFSYKIISFNFSSHLFY